MVQRPEDSKEDAAVHARHAALVRRARDGEDNAFGELYESLAPALFTWADYRLRLGPKVDPLDVVQETWCRAWNRLESFDPERVPFRAWLFRIAKNVAMEGLRRARSARGEASGPSTRLFALANLPDSITAVSQRMLRQERMASFRATLEALPEEERKLAVHCGLEGLPHREVADRLELSVAAVGKRWQRLRKRLVDEGLPEALVR